MIVQNSAMLVAQGNYNDVPLFYFSRWFNNVMPMYILAALYKVGLTIYDVMSNFLRLPIKNTLFAENFVLILSMCNVGIAMITSFSLLNKKRQTKTPLFILFFLYCLSIPIWMYTRIFYTDSMSFSFSIIGVAILFAAIENQYNWRKKILMFSISAVIYGFGWLLKPTSCFSIVALLIVLLLHKKDKTKKDSLTNYKVLIYASVLFATIFAGIIIISKVFEKNLPSNSPEMVETYRVPSLFWIGLGLENNGSYGDNLDYANEVLYGVPDYKSRDEYVKTYILENAGNFINLEHLKSKALSNFTEGDIKANRDAFITTEPVSEFLDFQNAPNAKWLYKYQIYTKAFWWFLCLLLLKHSIVQLISIKSKPMVPDQTMEQMGFIPEVLGDITLFGVVLFLMIWEANARQLYNSYPWILFLAAISICDSTMKKGEIVT
jgi:hypothetical protein